MDTDNNKENEKTDQPNEKNEQPIEIDESYIYGGKRKKEKLDFSVENKKRGFLFYFRRTMLCILIGLLSIILVVSVLLIYGIISGKNEMYDGDVDISAIDGASIEDKGKYIFYKGHKYKYNEDIINILFMGVDKKEFGEINGIVGTGGQTDTLLLSAVDFKRGDATTFNISRETMVDINLYTSTGKYAGTQKQQICLAYAYGDGKVKSCENTITSVQRLFYGLKVNSYLALDMSGVAVINDFVGGVTVVSPNDLTRKDKDIKYTKGETLNLKGDDALNFIRLRDLTSVNANNDRMQRQVVYINAFTDKLISMTKSNLSTPISLFNTAKEYTVTNLNASRVSYLAYEGLTAGISNFNIKSIPGKSKKGDQFVEYNVDQEKFFEMFLDVYYDRVD